MDKSKKKPASPKKVRTKKRVKTPTVLQMEAVECGAACLGIVLGYYGRIVPLEKLRLDCGISRDGSKASNILKAARTYGLKAIGARKSLSSLKELDCPLIVFWNRNHFVVLEGFKDDRVYINDPACGPQVVSEEEFVSGFSSNPVTQNGIVLSFEVTSEFVKGGEKPSLLGALRKRLSNSKRAVTYLVLISFMLVIPGLIIPTFSRIFVDHYLIDNTESWIKPLLIGMALTALARAILTFLQQYHLLRLETKLALSTSSQFLWHVLRLPIEFFTQRFAGDISLRVSINDKVAQLLSRELATTSLNIVMVIFFAFLMLQYDVLLTLVGILIALINVLMLRYISRKRTDENRKLLQERGKLMGTSIGGLQIIETLKATGWESDFFTRWSGYQTKVMNSEQCLRAFTLTFAAFPPFLVSFSNIMILFLGSLRVMDGHLTMGMLVAFQSLMTSFTQPFNKLINLGSLLQEAEGDMSRIDDVLLYPLDSHFNSDPAEAKNYLRTKLTGHIELKNIAFGYSKLEKPLIEKFILNVNPGSRIALVGSTGSGKSTVSKIVTGLYEPWEGQVLFDQKTINEIPRSVMVNSLAMVDQEIFLFEGSVKENLTLWDSTIPDQDIIQAAKDACIHDEIMMRPGGYNNMVEEGGRNFSGGQCQRLEIARALVSNPSILVLDEATSALDPITEQKIDDNLRRRGCTCLIIAHRLSTIRDSDEIIVLDKGKIVQRGSHVELCKNDGPYIDLVKASVGEGL